ncbi:hypothetical protein TrVFT333_001703 [Trichoderma virens FT-333]|nr:hypothetical protein TrVFT333_001703 [Trichoderma virens FT-333]
MSTMLSAANAASTFTAEELLTLDDELLFNYVKHSLQFEGGFDIFSSSGADTLSEPQRLALFARLTAAAHRVQDVERACMTRTRTLLSHLTIAPPGGNGSRKNTGLESPKAIRDRLESIYRKEVLDICGRPVVLDNSSLTPTQRARLPWVKSLRNNVPVMLEAQADRWWEFVRWQVDRRGCKVEDFGDYGFYAYAAAQQLRHCMIYGRRLGLDFLVMKAAWDRKTKLPENPCNAGFPAYEEEVKRRLALHNFTQEFQLKADPRQQDAWTTWVEYLGFEYWEADRLAASLRISEQHYNSAWKAFYPTSPLHLMVPEIRRVYEDVSLEQRLAKTQHDLEAMRELIREQGILTQWVLKQVHLIEAEDGEGKAPANKKRSRTEDEEAEAREGGHDLKRWRQGDAASEDIKPVFEPEMALCS